MDHMKKERQEWLKSLSEKSNECAWKDAVWCFAMFGLASMGAIGFVELVLWLG